MPSSALVSLTIELRNLRVEAQNAPRAPHQRGTINQREWSFGTAVSTAERLFKDNTDDVALNLIQEHYKKIVDSKTLGPEIVESYQEVLMLVELVAEENGVTLNS
jgi:hypothetical protein